MVSEVSGQVCVGPLGMSYMALFFGNVGEVEGSILGLQFGRFDIGDIHGVKECCMYGHLAV